MECQDTACPQGHTGGITWTVTSSTFSTPGATCAQQWRTQHSNHNAENQKQPNHTDLVRQVANWQVAILADLPINAQNTAIFPFNLVEAEISAGHVGQPAWAVPNAHQVSHRELPVPAVTSWHQRLFAYLPSGPWTFTLGTPGADQKPLLQPRCL